LSHSAFIWGKFVAGLRRLHAEHKLGFHGSLAALQNPKTLAAWLRPLFRSPGVVYAKRPFGGAQHALRYLGQYTHRVAISNHRLVTLADGMVTFRWRDSAHHNKIRLMTLPVNEFLRRFLLHVLPPGFVRIRYFGWMAHRRRGASFALCSQLLTQSGRVLKAKPAEKADSPPRKLWTCPQCGGPMSLSNGSAPWNFDGGLRPFPPGYNHDSIFEITASSMCPRAIATRVSALLAAGSQPLEIQQPVETPSSMARPARQLSPLLPEFKIHSSEVP
jgi:hypothetical protein